MSITNDLTGGPGASAQRTNSVQGRRTRDAYRVVNITKKWIDKLVQGQETARSKGRQFWYDAHDRHYWIELLPPNRVNHLVRWGKDLRRKIGEYPTMSVEEARKRVAACVVKLDDGEHPFDEQRVGVANVTLRDAAQYALDDRKRRARRADGMRRLERIFLDEHLVYPSLGKYLKRNLWKLTPDDVLDVQQGVKADAAGDGSRVASEVLRIMRAIINIQRLRIADPSKRPYNVVNIVTERHLWHRSARFVTKPFSPRELNAYIRVLNEWPLEQNPVHRYVSLIQLLTGFRRERAMTLRWCMERELEDELSYLHFKTSQSKSDREFDFPITPELRAVLDACKEFGSDEWVTPGVKFKQGEYEGPVNSDDWWETAFELAGISGSSKRVRQTVSTHLAILAGGQASSWLLDHSVAGASDVTALHYVEFTRQSHAWLRKWHKFLIKKGLRLHGLAPGPKRLGRQKSLGTECTASTGSDDSVSQSEGCRP
jgi:hypothetical protein